MKKKNEIINIIDELTALLAKEGKTMKEEDWNQNIGQLQAYITVLDDSKNYEYNQNGLADNYNFWKKQRKSIKTNAEKLNYFTKTEEELKAELKKAEEDEQAAYKIKGRNVEELSDAISRQLAAKYTLNNIK